MTLPHGLVMLVEQSWFQSLQGSPHLATTCRNRPPKRRICHVCSGLCHCVPLVSSNMIEKSCTNQVLVGNVVFSSKPCSIKPERYAHLVACSINPTNRHAATTPGKSLFLGSSVTNLVLNGSFGIPKNPEFSELYGVILSMERGFNLAWNEVSILQIRPKSIGKLWLCDKECGSKEPAKKYYV